jgi:hypothetical protein
MPGGERCVKRRRRRLDHDRQTLLAACGGDEFDLQAALAGRYVDLGREGFGCDADAARAEECREGRGTTVVVLLGEERNAGNLDVGRPVAADLAGATRGEGCDGQQREQAARDQRRKTLVTPT